LSSRLSGRVALVTGAGRGIGREIALAYAEESANLVVAARTVAELDSVAAEARGRGVAVVSVEADVGREADVKWVVEKALGEFDGIDILVNNAGITPGAAGRPLRSILDVTTGFWDETFGVNCRGPFLSTREVLPGMIERGGGVIVNITSKLSRVAVAGNAPYGPSKAALELLTLIVDAEFGEAGIRANLLHPGGPVATSIFNDYYQPLPGSRIGEPTDIRDPAVWLASNDAASVHGQVIDAREWNARHGQGRPALGGG
jgi:meso-butanediol dehydrogenase/(S,S)-butanediol dehydrogenase/diacetyl reductase